MALGLWTAALAAEQAHGEAGAHGAAGHGGGLAIDPMHQFQITSAWEFLGIAPKCTLPKDQCLSAFTFTNSALFMVIAVVLVSGFMLYSARTRSLVPDRLQSLSELAYEFVAKMVRENTGKAGMPFFPWVFSIFIFILTLNMVGMVPYAFTPTSHIIITFGLAMMVFLTVTVVGFIKNGIGFLRLFAPSGIPVWMLPLLVPIEAISYFIRPVSLSVRLFANMMAGHMLLKVVAAFVVALGFLGGWAPLGFMVAFTALEILVAFLQAFVFAVLTCIYLNDALHMHH